MTSWRERLLRPPGWVPAGLLALAFALLLPRVLAPAGLEPRFGWTLTRGLAEAVGLLLVAGSPLVLSALLARPAPRRTRVLVVVACLAILAVAVVLEPLAWSRTNEAALAFPTTGVPILPPPSGWSWAQRLQALSSGLTPDGATLNVLLRRDILETTTKECLRFVGAALVLSVALRRRTQRLHPLLALAAVALLLRNPSLAAASAAGPMRFAALAALLVLPFALVAALAHAWCSRDARSARRAWLATAAPLALVAILAVVAPRLLAAAAAPRLRVGSVAERLVVQDFAGQQSVVEPGGDVLVLSYWASWCGWCRKEQQFLDELRREPGVEGLRLVSVNNGEDLETARRAWAELGVGWEPFMPTESLVASYPVASFPSSYVVGRDGVVVGVHVGFRPEDLDAEIRAALARPRP